MTMIAMMTVTMTAERFNNGMMHMISSPPAPCPLHYNAAASTSILSSATGTISATATNSARSSNGSGGNTGNSQPGNAQTTNNAAAGSAAPKAASVAAFVGLIGLAWL
ncbi:hypothetical protein Asppvi_004046 [Aspergillus pseudoviridinutans]|uniref:Uncharacterized protein n=1 Tax=Aspergillus pseudoviridinutans TaxID=1517512 RepID=A0A9P3B704_9EURO|nr:uncharacterized protein Asppvi_004046 [Aspergillus pseudoviridinutans]GIJ85190.1 hypothetical protein Asppvi_004046 [Aspergillus pseudoviridinutans]